MNTATNITRNQRTKNSRTVITFLGSLAFMFALCCNSLHASQNVYESAILSTTYIVCPDTSSAGSGVLVDKANRLVVTNQHVVEDADEILIFFPIELQGQLCCDQEYYYKHAKELAIVATVVAIDIKRDIALLQLESLPSHVRAIEFGASAKPGQMVHSIGNPGSSDAMWIYTNGYVRANYFKKMTSNRMQVVETSSPINQGDSGGPMLNDSGKLIGISQSYMTKGRLVSNGVDISEITWFINKSMNNHPNRISNAGNSTKGDAPTHGSAKATGSAADLLDRVLSNSSTTYRESK